jgi:hypothetical protein
MFWHNRHLQGAYTKAALEQRAINGFIIQYNTINSAGLGKYM